MLLRKIRILAFFISLGVFLKAQPLHEYFFNNTLNSPVGPALTQTLGSAGCPGSAGAFSTQTLTIVSGSCGVATAFCFNQGAGLKYPNPSYITNQYTIHLFFKFNTLTGYSRVIDFSNSVSDNGIYLLNTCLNFYPSGNVGTCPFFAANTYYLYTFVRNSAGTVTAYVNGTLFTTYNDVSNYYVCATNTSPITFFRDDNTVPCESKAGCIKYASISSATSTAAQVATVWTNICSVVLPVELSKFEVEKKDNQAHLTWTTQTEKNNKLFEIERSQDAEHFHKIGEMEGAGNSHNLLSYSFKDDNPGKETIYYRLKQINTDNSYTYSGIVHASFTEGEIEFYPNPAADLITIKAKNKIKKVIIRSVLGQDMLTLDAISENGKVGISELPNGAYIICIGELKRHLIINR